MTPCLSLASYPALDVLSALSGAQKDPPMDPFLGVISFDYVQLCPQNCIGILGEYTVNALRAQAPQTRFRLHANVRVEGRHHPRADASTVRWYGQYFQRLAGLSRDVGADAYTVHVGRRSNATWPEILYARDRLEKWFGVPVGLEGMYPTDDRRYWLDDWSGCRDLLNSGVPFALDLSHLKIVAHKLGYTDEDVLGGLLSSPQCIEVHISDNDGQKDSHGPLTGPPYGWDAYLNAKPKAVTFYEGNLVSIKPKG